MRAGVLLVVSLLFSPALSAAIYTCVDAQGQTMFRDVPCRSGESRARAAKAPRGSRATAVETEAGQGPSREQVERLLAEMDKGFERRNARRVAALLARDAAVEFEVKGAGEPQEMTLSKAQFAEYLQKAFEKGVPGPSPREKTRISISKRLPRATVTFLTLDTLHLQGRAVKGQMRTKLTVEMQRGRPVIRRYDALMTVDESRAGIRPVAAPASPIPRRPTSP
jgi:hypothetical protein